MSILVTKNCLICGKDIPKGKLSERQWLKRKVCSPICVSKYRGRLFRGEKHFNWKGQIGSKERQKLMQKLRSQGKTYQEIGETLSITRQRVEQVLKGIYRRGEVLDELVGLNKLSQRLDYQIENVLAGRKVELTDKSEEKAKKPSVDYSDFSFKVKTSLKGLSSWWNKRKSK